MSNHVECPSCYIVWGDFDYFTVNDHKCSKKKLRDQFAMAALIPLVTRGSTEVGNSVLARASYALADAMLRAREETRKEEV